MAKPTRARKKIEATAWGDLQPNSDGATGWQADRERDVKVRHRKRPEKPLTDIHKAYTRAIETHPVTFSVGPAGTGKTSLACGLALRMLAAGDVSRIVLTRPIVQCDEELGILPGTLEEKMAPYLAPMCEVIKELLGAAHFESLIRSGAIEICPLATMRGRTMHSAVVILDEAQNATYRQIRMFLTRMGENAKMVVNGDCSQSDLTNSRKHSGLLDAIARLEGGPEIAVVRMTRAECLRPPLVQWIDEQLERE